MTAPCVTSATAALSTRSDADQPGKRVCTLGEKWGSGSPAALADMEKELEILRNAIMACCNVTALFDPFHAWGDRIIWVEKDLPRCSSTHSFHCTRLSRALSNMNFSRDEASEQLVPHHAHCQKISSLLLI